MTVEQEHSGRRERRKLATKEAIARAALTLAVDERGLSNITVEEIADRADVSYRTFFNYFSSKEEAALWLGPSLAREHAAFIAARPPESPLDTVAAFVHYNVDRLAGYKDILEMRSRAASLCPSLAGAMQAQIHELDAVIEDAFAARFRASGDDEIAPFLIARVAAAVFEISARSVVKGSTLDEVHARVDGAIDMLRAGLDPRGTMAR